MGRFDTGEDAVILHELIVIDVFQCGEVYGGGVGNADSGGDILHRGEVVTRNDFNGDIVILKELDNFTSVATDFVL